MSQHTTLAIVAILGRPNVGKSRLFNRYAGRRRALVEDAPGITRDRIAEEVEVAGRRVLLVDTAGLDPDADAGLAAAVQAQARAAAEEADAILFVVDAKTGLLPQDAEIARVLRRTRGPLLLAVNKIDRPDHDVRAAEFHSLGIEPVRPISAEHGRGAWEALEELAMRLPPAREREQPTADEPRVAIVGRPNVGKSSLLNRLAGAERVVVSEAPGTTRDAVDVRLRSPEGSLVLVDTAGLRRPGRRTQLAERGSALMAVRALERAEVALVLFDAGEGLGDQDVRVAGLARERGCATALIANKWDRLEERGPEAAERLRDEVARRLRFMSDAPLLGVSALRGTRTRRVLPLVWRLYATGRRRIDTPELNRWLREAVSRHEPAMAQRGSRRRPVKFFYAAQTGVSPPSFVLFCSDPRSVARSYRRFLENRLRRAFDLAGTPVRLRLRARGDPA